MAATMELDRFAGMLAHELRNPLASATTNLAVAVDLMEETDPRSPFIRQAEREMDRIRRLLDSCIALATAGRVQRREVPVTEVLEEAAACAVPETGPDLQHEGDEGLRASLDPALMQRALANLFENSVKALAGRCGVIKATATSGEEGLRLVIEDSGPGIPEEMRTKVFDPLVTGLKGSGLGLAFVKKVVEAHGGTIDVGGSPLGGARFEIFIPDEV